MSDYIKREDAIEEICKGCNEQYSEEPCEPSDCGIMQRIADIPSADVRENVKGRWVEVVDRTEMYDKEGVKTWGMLFQCNQCGFVLNAIEGHTGQYNYCPNCGADMRREDNGRDEENHNRV